MLPETIVFDAGRAVLEDYLDGSLYPARLNVTDSQPLAEGQLAPETHLLTFEHMDILHVIPMNVVLCYNVIQGETNGKPWMMTFCNACNTGMLFDPVMNGQTLHFRRRGSYDGLLLIWDEETNSYWQHITGHCLHGSSQGKQLQMIALTRHMTAAEAGARTGEVRLLTATITDEQAKLSRAMEKMRSNPDRIGEFIGGTLVQEDTRRPRFELGLGVWTGQTSIFFPLTMLHLQDNMLLTELDDRPLLIYHAPEAIAPVAAYVMAKRGYWEGEILRLDGGAYIQNDLYHTADGQVKPLECPMQLLMRWYGFALTFPGCRVASL
ncbi:MAG: DUF3179 domain-containing protein [Anaerolineae bacterium]|nr:DUF3179 domain-containing protein [Anaerolineae bacterium]